MRIPDAPTIVLRNATIPCALLDRPPEGETVLRDVALDAGRIARIAPARRAGGRGC